MNEKCYDCETTMKIIWWIGDNAFGSRGLFQCPKCKNIFVRDVAEEKKETYFCFNCMHYDYDERICVLDGESRNRNDHCFFYEEKSMILCGEQR